MIIIALKTVVRLHIFVTNVKLIIFVGILWLIEISKGFKYLFEIGIILLNKLPLDSLI